MSDAERMKFLFMKLGEAIENTLNDSGSIADAIADIQNAGFEVFLVLEAKVGFIKREDNAEPPKEAREYKQLVKENGEIVPKTFNGQDKKFLRGLNITLE